VVRSMSASGAQHPQRNRVASCLSKCCIVPTAKVLWHPHSKLRAAISPTPRQQGVEGQETSQEAPHWRWARLLQRVFTLDMETYPGASGGHSAPARNPGERGTVDAEESML
jgi:hypothetical protein